MHGLNIGGKKSLTEVQTKNQQNDIVEGKF